MSAELQQRVETPSDITNHNETPDLNPNTSTSDQYESISLDSGNVSVEARADNNSKTIPYADFPNKDVEVNVSAKASIESTKENATEKSEDIPSFSEWTQKQLEEVEKKKELVNNSAQPNNGNGKFNGHFKLRSKNYAAPDCGAKIVAANPEAISASAVLTPSRDESNLSPCNKRIWFIVELCEAIQAKKIDLANFELFSSSPKDFSVYVSDRHPTRDWSNVGHFTANNERNVQSFDLHPHLFGKFIKVEMHSHYGAEHYCPMSLFRVYGTSEFEVLEKEDQVHSVADEDDDDDDGEEMMDTNDGHPQKNLLSSATDVVISIVKKAAEVLGNNVANNSNHTATGTKTDEIKQPPSIKICSTPSHLIVCNNCSRKFFDHMYELMSCHYRFIYTLARITSIKIALHDTDTCNKFGFDFFSTPASNSCNPSSLYVMTILTCEWAAALCNTIAVNEKKVVLNHTMLHANITKDVIRESKVVEEANVQNDSLVLSSVEESKKVKTDDPEVIVSPPQSAADVSSLNIKQTETIPSDNDSNFDLLPEINGSSKIVQPSEAGISGNQFDSARNDTDIPTEQNQINSNRESLIEYEVTTESSENFDLELITELNSLGTNATNTVSTTAETVPHVKETVFLRLSNRIKALERNMSLSSQYLEKLSRRYKKQVEEMQKLLEKTLVALNEDNKNRDEYNRKLEEKLTQLSNEVSILVAGKHNWMTTTCLLLTLLFVTLSFYFCKKSKCKCPHNDAASENCKIQRRRTIDVIRGENPMKKVRRPSEEALKVSGTYKNLMVDNLELKKRLKEKRKRRKKNSIDRFITCEASGINDVDSSRNVSDSLLLVTSNIMLNRQESAPAEIPIMWNTGLHKRQIDETPFPLEESEISPLQSLPVPKLLESGIKSIRNSNGGNVPFVETLRDAISNTLAGTAIESRPKRKSKDSQINDDVESSNVDDKHVSSGEISRQASPISMMSVDSLQDKKVVNYNLKKEKKGLKRIFKKVF